MGASLRIATRHAGVLGIASVTLLAMRWLGCKRRKVFHYVRCALSGTPGEDREASSTSGDGKPAAPVLSQVLPDLALGMIAPFLKGVDIAKLMNVDQSCSKAFAYQGFWEELLLLRGFRPGSKSTLAHVHLAEILLVEENVTYFDFMSTELSSRSVSVINKFAAVLKFHPRSTARIEAHAQPGAPRQIATRIALARADVVVAALVERDVERNRIKAGTFGTARPLMDPDESRRAEIFIMLDGMQFPADALPVVSWKASKRWAAWVRGEHPGRSTSSSAVIVQGEGASRSDTSNDSEESYSGESSSDS